MRMAWRWRSISRAEAGEEDLLSRACPIIPDMSWRSSRCRVLAAMIAFDLGSLDSAPGDFSSGSKLCSLAESLGGVETLISHPATMTHASVPARTARKAGNHRWPGPHLRRHRRRRRPHRRPGKRFLATSMSWRVESNRCPAGHEGSGAGPSRLLRSLARRGVSRRFTDLCCEIADVNPICPGTSSQVSNTPANYRTRSVRRLRARRSSADRPVDPLHDTSQTHRRSPRTQSPAPRNVCIAFDPCLAADRIARASSSSASSTSSDHVSFPSHT